MAGQRSPWTEIERLTLRKNKKRDRTERFCGSGFFHLIQAGVYLERFDVFIFFEAGFRLGKSKFHIELPLFGCKTGSPLFRKRITQHVSNNLFRLCPDE